MLLVLGTRPEIVKLAPVALALHEAGVRVQICLTGQHLELARPFLRLFPFRPDHVLNAMRRGQSLGRLTSRLVSALDGVVAERGFDALVVQGDTSSAMVGALVGFYRHVPVAHVEAGLRTSSIAEPFPEEANRRIISTLATWHYAPTRMAGANLMREGVTSRAICVTGNTGIDTLLACAKNAPVVPSGQRQLLITVHRRENFGVRLEHICDAIAEIIARSPSVSASWILHPNPAVASVVRSRMRRTPRVKLLPPQPYERFVGLLTQSYLLLTDSGGIQEEATVLGRPVLILRTETERPEVINAGNGILVGAEANRIVSETLALLTDRRRYRTHARRSRVFGDGRAAVRVAAHLARELNADGRRTTRTE